MIMGKVNYYRYLIRVIHYISYKDIFVFVMEQFLALDKVLQNLIFELLKLLLSQFPQSPKYTKILYYFFMIIYII